MTSSGDSLRPNRMKPGDLVLHFVGDEDEVRFVVMSYIEDILIEGGETSLVTESLVTITPYKTFLN